MEPNTQNSSGMMNGIPPIPKQDRKIGPIIGVLIIVLVLIIAALYFFGQKLNTTNTEQPAALQTTNTENSASASSSTSDAALKADLDAQLKDIDYSF